MNRADRGRGLSPAQWFMQNPQFSRIYERAWRPVFTRGFGLGSTAVADYDRALMARLSQPGDRRILDVACGPGNHTRTLAAGLTGDGAAVGLDYSAAMLATAAGIGGERISYVRGDAHEIPFASGSFDVTVCLAALYLIPDPLPVIDELVRVTRPGGEIVVFASVTTALTRLPGMRAIAGLGGMRFFEPAEIPDRFREAGAVDVAQTVIGQGQYVTGRRATTE